MPVRPAKFISEIEALRNLGPKSAAWLAEIGITTRAQLARIGAIETCRRLRKAGHPANTIMAYAIEGALMDCHWRALPFEFRKNLRLEWLRLRREHSPSRPMHCANFPKVMGSMAQNRTRPKCATAALTRASSAPPRSGFPVA